jgi:hydroxyacylglutathione hydrolase
MIESIVIQDMGVNCYLLSCDNTQKAILIDPGAGAKRILNWLEKCGKDIIFIVLTHGHFDHIGAVEELRNELKVKVAIHQGDAEMLINPLKNLSRYSGRDLGTSPAEIILQDNQELSIGEMEVRIFHTPGHSLGSISLLTKDGLLSGDTLFDGSVGRTDFPGGDTTQLLKSIQDKLLVLDDEIKVFPGHGPTTTIGKERRFNPYVNGVFG